MKKKVLAIMLVAVSIMLISACGKREKLYEIPDLSQYKTVVCGFIASMLATSVSMLVAAKMHTISVVVCISFFLYCLLPFIYKSFRRYGNR